MVFEREPWWAPELRRRFQGDDIRVRHCIDLSSVTTAAACARDCLVVVGLRGLERECTELLRHHSRLRTLVVAGPDHDDLELPFREAGVLSFTAEPLSGEDLAARIRRIRAAAV